MKLLLDTHILLWALSNDEKLSKEARKLIENTDNEIYYSIVSLWEIELKRIAHPNLMLFTAQDISIYCKKAGFLQVPVKERHIFTLGELKRREDAPPHKDPFDRLLICQASSENMLLVTHDSLIPQYIEPCILAV